MSCVWNLTYRKTELTRTQPFHWSLWRPSPLKAGLVRNKPPASAKSYKAPALKGRRVLADNGKANVEKWELRRLEILIDSVRLLLNKIPRRREENKGRRRGVPPQVKLCQPELRSDERTGADLCSKWKPTPARLKKPAFTPSPWCHSISSGPCAFSWQPPRQTTLFFSQSPAAESVQKLAAFVRWHICDAVTN